MVGVSPTMEDTEVRKRMTAVVNVQSSPNDSGGVFERVSMKI
jgi:hypothetical protein